ncbi:MBL fold metallo-hydrolase [Herbidospora galbida]|uniref:MBL fold metallo-hydrolase n=1 Tax=Herbidospora galbida TaxID=2575442 RepID=A0A4U3MKS5_9ACTN|nr:MBL fold metallo-hydrolase [Herbidospora galbida]
MKLSATRILFGTSDTIDPVRRPTEPASPAQHAAWLAGRLPEVERVRPGLWSIPVPLPNTPLRYVLVYALELPGGVALIDAGWDTEEAYAALTAGLKTAGYDVTDVRAVLVTHMHPDHYGLAGRVREDSGAWIGLHPADARLLRGRYDDPEDLSERELRLLLRSGIPEEKARELAGSSMAIRRLVSAGAPDRLIEDGTRLDLPGWDLTAIWTPGHSPGHLCFAGEGLLFSGDHVLAKITPMVAFHPQSAPDPLADYLDALRAVGRLDVEEVLPAHEYRFPDLLGRVEYVISHHHDRLAEIERVVSGEPGLTCWQIATRLTWSRPWESIQGFQLRAANNETLAHLIYLEAKGRLREERNLYYK